ncbi:MAG: metallophosphoesterase [Actinomycetota bacterium]
MFVGFQRFQRLRTQDPRTTARFLAKWLAVILVALLGASIGIGLGAHVSSRLGPFDATLSLRSSASGGTVVQVAPLGEIRLRTHRGPLAVHASIDQLRPAEADRIVRDPSTLASIEGDIARDTQRAVRELVLRAFIFGAIGAAAMTALVVRRPLPVLVGLLAALLVMVGGGIASAATWDPKSLAEPRYSGLLSRAPAAIGDAKDILSRFSEYRAQLSALVLNVSRLYAAGSTLPNFSADESIVRVLHVSDIHLNPQAFDLIQQLVQQFKIDVIADTGDIADWGTDLESGTARDIGPLGVPYVFVRGNHDSGATENAVRAQPNAVVLDGDGRTVAGLRFFGIADPRFTPDKRSDDSTSTQKEIMAKFAQHLKDALAQQDPPPQIVLTHDPSAAALLKGPGPLVLAGHLHEHKQIDQEGTTILVEGSTGGAGLRGLEGEKPTPLSASILYFERATGRLAAYDTVTLGGLGEESANIARKVILPPKPPGDPTPSPSNDSPTSGLVATPFVTYASPGSRRFDGRGRHTPSPSVVSRAPIV